MKGTYELNVGKVIEETFEGKDAALIPAALVRGHGPFVWGETPERAVENAAVLDCRQKRRSKRCCSNRTRRPRKII